MKKKVINKGYTLEVESFENDGDNYATNKVTYETSKLAISVARMCEELFNSDVDGVGNSTRCEAIVRTAFGMQLNTCDANITLVNICLRFAINLFNHFCTSFSLSSAMQSSIIRHLNPSILLSSSSMSTKLSLSDKKR